VTTSAEINVYDISVEAGVALRDLLSLNPVIVPDTSLAPGTQLARPCYVSGAPTYFGADIAQVRSCMPLLVSAACRNWPSCDDFTLTFVRQTMQTSKSLRHVVCSHMCFIIVFCCLICRLR